MTEKTLRTSPAAAATGAGTTSRRPSPCRRPRCAASAPRVLDPGTAERIGNEPAPRPVAYVPHRLWCLA